MRPYAKAIGIVIAIAPWPLCCAAQAQPAKCNLPPPLVCPPDPPTGPKTVQDIDIYIGSLDSVIATNEAAARNSGKAPLNDYVGDLKDYRDRLASYRNVLEGGDSGGSAAASDAGPP